MDETTILHTIEAQSATIEVLERENRSLKMEKEIRHERSRLKKIRMGKSRHFTKVYHTAMKEIMPMIKPNEGYLLLLLIPYVEFITGYLVKERQRMCLTDISKLSKWSIRNTRSVVKDLIEKGILLEEKDGTKKNYRVNSKYLFAGVEEANHWNEEEGAA